MKNKKIPKCAKCGEELIYIDDRWILEGTKYPLYCGDCVEKMGGMCDTTW